MTPRPSSRTSSAATRRARHRRSARDRRLLRLPAPGGGSGQQQSGDDRAGSGKTFAAAADAHATSGLVTARAHIAAAERLPTGALLADVACDYLHAHETVGETDVYRYVLRTTSDGPRICVVVVAKA